MRWDAAAGLAGMLAAVNDFLAQPFPLYYTPQTPRFLLLGTALYAVVAIVITANHKNTRPGEEHGSARWGNVFALNRKYMDKDGPNLLLTRHFGIGVDGYKHKHNTNILVVGGSGAGKTRTYAVPNVLEAARAGRQAARFVREPRKKEKKQEAILKAENGVRYTIPQHLNVDRMDDQIVVRFRVDNIYQNKSVVVYFDGKETMRRKKRILAPGEMEQITLKKSGFSDCPDVKEIRICLED